jgi:hypothetical protein
VLGYRLDQFKWDGEKLTLVKNLHRQRALQDDVTNRTNPAVPAFRGNHNGGVVRTGPDGKLYLIVGDTGRRGQMQNLVGGPFQYPIPPATEPLGPSRTTSSAVPILTRATSRA